MQIKKELFEGIENLAVAVSGGRDSMALLHYLQNNVSCNLSVINVDHGIRGKASEEDSLFVKEYCEKHSIPLYFKKVDCIKYANENGVSLELAARCLRHDFFKSVLSEENIDAISLAHHADDNVETVLMREFRGTGIVGLSAMKERENGYIRPFLYVTRKEIDEYVKENAIPYVDDESNFESVFTRNYIRREIIPAIEKRYPSFRESLIRLCRSADEANAFIDEYVKQPSYSVGGGVKIPFQQEILFKRAVVSAYKMLGVNSDIEYRHQKLIYDFSVSGSKGYLDLPFDTKSYLEGNFVIISRDNNINTEDIQDFLLSDKEYIDIELCAGLRLEITKGQKVFELLKNYIPLGKDTSFSAFEERGYAYSFCDLTGKDFTVRLKKDGDIINCFGSGKKALGDVFTDKKVYLRYRNFLPVVASGSTVYNVMGFLSSEDAKVTPHSKNPIACKLIIDKV